MKFCIIGLGNPGKKYERTRHNAGFMAVDDIARRGNVVFNQAKHQAFTGRGRVESHEVLLVKPQTYMNESGRAAALVLKDAYLTAEALIVLHDELDLPLGTVRIKAGGGHGGHNGLRSLIEHLGTADFTRIRIGIGRPLPGMETADFVLSSFSGEERSAAAEAVARAAEAAVAVMSLGVTRAMNSFNQK